MVNSHVVRTSERSSSAPASNLMNLSRGYRHQIRMRVKLETTQVKGIFNDPFPGSKRLSDIGKSAKAPHMPPERDIPTQVLEIFVSPYLASATQMSRTSHRSMRTSLP